MRSLFVKILLWFLVSTVITVLGFVITTEVSLTATRGRGHLFSRLLAFPLEEARHAYETRGREGLAAFLGRFRSVFEAEGVLTDASGTDLLTGADRRDLLASAQRRPVIPFFRGGPVVIAHATDQGHYWFFLIIHGQRGRLPFFLPQYLWLVGAVVLLSYGLTLHLTSPLRSLQRAVERFGRGDFSSRVKSKRRDELGQLARTFDQMAERIQTLLAAERRLHNPTRAASCAAPRGGCRHSCSNSLRQVYPGGTTPRYSFTPPFSLRARTTSFWPAWM